MLQFSSADSVTTFASDCSTAKSSWNLGETVCAHITGPTSGSAVLRRVQLVDANNFVVDRLDVLTNPQEVTFDLPSNATDTLDGGAIDNRGTWRVETIDTDGDVRATTPITVHDPNQTVADLQITKSLLNDSTATAGAAIQSKIWVFNNGPDAAANVVVNDVTPANTTFQSLTQTDGPTFNCTTPAVNGVGTSVCTLSSLPNGGTAGFVVTYLVSSSIASNTDLTSTASATSDTTDRNTADNSTTQDVGTNNPTNPTCTLSCPGNISATADTVEGGVSGTHVTLPDATASGSTCGTVTSSIASGSFFPVGSTPVTYTAADGTTCEFIVTVTSSGAPVSISCPASVTANADADCQVAVTLGTPATTGDNVVVTSTRSDGKPLSAQFTSGTTTVTWTATGYTSAAAAAAQDPSQTTGTVSCTQTVTILDVTPPVINIPAQTASADANCQAAIPDLTTNPGITDNCACGSSDLTEACAGHSMIAVTQSPAPGTLVGLGPHTITVTANDGSQDNGGNGNTTTANITFTVVDTTPPVISCPANIVVYLPLHTPDTSMAVSYPAATATDNCGTPTITYSQASGSVFPVGTTTVTATANDGHGNTASCSFTVTVLYDFTGFFAPVANPPTLNVVNAGRAIPVKFSLSGNKGLNIFAANSPQSGVIPCDASAPAQDLTDTLTAGSSSLSYDATSDQYNYVWATQSSWAGTCRQLQVTLNDGTTHVANFKFK
jgi:uncharacterized repeat protein (TIGR01451 family)